MRNLKSRLPNILFKISSVFNPKFGFGIFIFGLVVFPLLLFATHNRAGEITYKQVSGYTYEITLTTYTDSRSIAADRPKVDIIWGDNTTEEIARVAQSSAGQFQNTFINVYKKTHTYPGPGTYLIQFLDPNRIANINNIGNSINTPFYVESELQINPSLGYNSSPILLQPPIDFAKVGQKFIHNPNAFDADGDSLDYSLIPPKERQNTPVNYSTPPATVRFGINRTTGELVWENPTMIGIYNIAILVREYRNKKLIGYIVRDMQIMVQDAVNLPPIISELKDTCVEAGKNIVLQIPISARDDAGQFITLTGSGGPLLQSQNPALLQDNPATGKGSVASFFTWEIKCNHIRKYPYRMVFRAVDDFEKLPLSDIKHFDIRVVGPAPKNLEIVASGNGVNLKWEKPDCNHIGYFIYRKVDSSRWNPKYCEVGIPSYTGFELIDTISNPNTTTYYDNNKGVGLSPGAEYCYRVTAVYLSEGQFEYVEGYAGNEQCVKLKKDVPVITHISIRNTDIKNGASYVAWSKPSEIDTLQNLPPYTYQLYRTEGFSATGGQLLNTYFANSFYDLKDSIFIDTLINTKDTAFAYRVEFYNGDSAKKTYIGRTMNASSIYLSTKPSHYSVNLSWKVIAPWNNQYFVIYRYNLDSNRYDSIATTPQKSYLDTGLILGKSYCYKVKSVGGYRSSGFVYPIINFSQEACAIPRDTFPPCPPDINAVANCDGFSNLLSWIDNNTECNKDVTHYKIYYAYRREKNFTPIDSIPATNPFNYEDKRQSLRYSIAGCYFITSVDSFINESDTSNIVCTDNCPRYKLPNIFTPNNDGKNDLFIPFSNYRFIEKIDLKVFNRWGQEVFKTSDPAINWDGTDSKTKLPLSVGVYYYHIKVYYLFLDETKLMGPYQGTIQIIR